MSGRAAASPRRPTAAPHPAVVVARCWCPPLLGGFRFSTNNGLPVLPPRVPQRAPSSVPPAPQPGLEQPLCAGGPGPPRCAWSRGVLALPALSPSVLGGFAKRFPPI